MGLELAGIVKTVDVGFGLGLNQDVVVAAIAQR